MTTNNAQTGSAAAVSTRAGAGRRLAESLLLPLARTAPAARVLNFLVRRDPTLVIEPLGQRLNRGARFTRVSAWPESLDGFDRLSFLFSSNPLNMGIVLLTLDEAAYLYKTVRELGPATIVEIGRFKGGSTFLIAAAMAEGSTLYSYDLHVKLTHEFRGEELDAELVGALRRYGLAERVHLRVADSRTAEPPPSPCDLVFIDGDHTYEGVRADYEHWRRLIRRGGHLLFHDATAQRDFGSFHPEVAQLVSEIERDDAAAFARRGQGGSIVHFVRTEASADWAG